MCCDFGLVLEVKQDTKPKIHSVRTANLVGIIHIRNRSCFYIICKNNQERFTNEVGEKKIVSIIYF